VTDRAEVLALEIPCDERAPGSVRRALGELDCLGWILGDVMLVATELVTNAVLHSGCSAEDLLAVEARLAGGAMTIEVRDPGFSGQSARVRSENAPIGGWGLQIVDTLAAHWGSERCGGYRVWAEIAVGGEGN
jgi:anti-sigma regulatory factor (Ser/Thr protein kinase)